MLKTRLRGGVPRPSALPVGRPTSPRRLDWSFNMKERIKDYRRFVGQNYFRGNTAARSRRIRDLDKRIFYKRFRQGMLSLIAMMDNGVI